MIGAATRALVRERARARCEYCGLAQTCEPFFTFHIEHIVARQHGGTDEAENLALACYHCNCHKGPNLTAVDPQSGQVVPLFDPRQQVWSGHFRQVGEFVEGQTAFGRATASLLKMNAPERRRLRE